MKRKHFLLLLLLFSASTVSIFSCKKQSDIENSFETNRIEKLALEYTKPIAENYPSLKSAYSGLNESELRIFWLNIYRINNQKAKSEISEEQFLKQYENYNKKSTTQFGKTINKITDAEMLKVVLPERNSESSFRPIDPPPNPDCPFLPYPEYYYWGSDIFPPSAPFISWRLVDFYFDDCDGYELTYSGFYSRLRAITPLGAQAIALFLQGDHIFSPTRTRVLHKKSSADYWFGNVNNINNHIRMTLPYEE